jgi:DNA-directed RNA polymerase subunit beta
VPHGEKGIVVATKVFSRYRYVCETCEAEYKTGKPLDRECERCMGRLRREPGDELLPGVNQLVRVYVAQQRKIMVGDKLTGRHGNKGVIARIVAAEDMPYLADGTAIDVCLNPLTVPSRMNIGQILETHLGLVAQELGRTYVCPIFEGAPAQEIETGLHEVNNKRRAESFRSYVECELTRFGGLVNLNGEDTVETVRESVVQQLVAAPKEPVLRLAEWLGITEEDWTAAATSRKRAELIADRALCNSAQKKEFDARTGRFLLFDGRTGEPFNQPVTVGMMYILKLLHLVDDKIHARSTGPYSLVTQQPLGGKAQFGGQRFGEMEVWALEAYGAAYTLQEILTLKSDDVVGRVKTYEAIVKGANIAEPGIPESFKILIKELQSLALEVAVETREGQAVELRDADEDYVD